LKRVEAKQIYDISGLNGKFIKNMRFSFVRIGFSGSARIVLFLFAAFV
jgi:hypothetical protein